MRKSKIISLRKSPERKGVGAYKFLFNPDNGVKKRMEYLSAAYFVLVEECKGRDVRKILRKNLRNGDLSIRIPDGASMVPGKDGYFIPMNYNREILVLFPFPGLSNEKEVMIYLKKETIDLEKVKKFISELEKAMPKNSLFFYSIKVSIASIAMPRIMEINW